MSYPEFLKLNESAAEEKILLCCQCSALAKALVRERHRLSSLESLQQAAKGFFLSLPEEHWLEAFAAHPRIGEFGSLKEKFAATKEMAGGEQSGVQGAQEEVLQDLKRLNEEYEAKFGFVFLVFATGKSAGEMLSILKERISNSREQELRNAAEEQVKIMSLRMEKTL